MMNMNHTVIDFEQAQMWEHLQAASDEELDALRFGVIAFDAEQRVCRYNRLESALAIFKQDEVIGQHVFVELAPCLNNYLVAGRFEEAREAGQALDVTMPYVLTFRMRPTRVRMRLLAAPGHAVRYMLVDRLTGSAA